MVDTEIVLSVKGITKKFGSLLANDDISFDLHKGQVLALLGENGAGKTTLMNIIFGHYLADEGHIEAFGHELKASNPAEAISLGIGMVHQHFTLAENLTVLDNIILGTEPLWAPRQGKAAARAKLAGLAEDFGLVVDPDAKVGDLTVGERQRVEILKALYRDARILILDEPTAVLTPQEAENLFATLQGLLSRGLSVIFISHKLNEVMAIADDIAVLRHGKLVASFAKKDATREIIAQKMVGQAVAKPVREDIPPGDLLLELEAVSLVDGHGRHLLKNLNFSINRNQIIGIAGVSGNGQKNFSDIVSGLAAPARGSVKISDRLIEIFDPASFIDHGIGRIPEDRHKDGVVGDFTVEENMVLETFRKPTFSRTGWLRGGEISRYAARLIDAFDIRGANAKTIVRGLSGGNMQKVILARVLDEQPDIILANQPTRGLDVGAAAFVHAELFKAKASGRAVILISEDLEELLALSDKVAVMYQGQITAPVDVSDISLMQLGLLMSGQGFEPAKGARKDAA